MKYIKNHKDEIFLILIIFSVLFLSGPIIILFITGKITFSFINQKNINTWIGYYGTVIGGAITMVGVWWTLNTQQKQFEKNLKEQKQISDIDLQESKRQFEIQLQKKNEELDEIKKSQKNELILLYKPIIDISFSKPIETLGGMLTFNMILENVGRGEAIDISANTKQLNGPAYLLFPNNHSIKIIPKGKKMICHFTFSKPKKYNENHIKEFFPLDKNNDYTILITLNYIHPLDLNIKYELICIATLNKSIPESEYSKIKSTEQTDGFEEEWTISITELKTNYSW